MAQAQPSLEPQPAQKLYLQLSSVGLDAARVYHVRDASFDRAAIHFTLSDGTLAFTTDVEGKVTGAFFEGDGEVLLMPPDHSERASMALFTGGAILEEHILSAYFRFNDDTYQELRPYLREGGEHDEFVPRWNESARTLAQADALRLFLTFSRFLPVDGGPPETQTRSRADRFLHARLQGRRLGTFDLYFDTEASEQVWAGQAATRDNATFYDVWTSFATVQKSRDQEAMSGMTAEEGKTDGLLISRYKIRASVMPPTALDVNATLDIDVHSGGARAVLFELSRYLHIRSVESDGKPLEFIQNPAIEGTQLSRRGNDLVAVVFPRSLRTGEKVQLHFEYAGEVLSEAGPGLLYVGARGTWYPNRGIAMSTFDLQFQYPVGWTLIATGKPESATATVSAELRTSRFVSERPIPLAGFNLGKYSSETAQAGETVVTAYATDVMERGTLTTAQTKKGVSPARNAEAISERAAQAIDFYSRSFGPYPYSQLSLTQMPGPLSQGWPSMIFLSSLAFLTPEQAAQLRMDPVNASLTRNIVTHETAHQWWGDLLLWCSYRDQWLVEALANYSSLMLLESEDPQMFRNILTRYRDDLLLKNKDGVPLADAGAVALGSRLSSSHFPGGYDAISYGRGTWLMHMLRMMMRDAEVESSKSAGGPRASATDERFIRTLRKLRDQYQGKAISTQQFLEVVAGEMPPTARYSADKKLSWFLDGWIYGTAVPEFELSSLKYTDRAQVTVVSGTLRQKYAPNDLVSPVPIYAVTGAGKVYLGRVFADNLETQFHLTAPAGTRKIVIDPEGAMLSRNE